MNACHHKTIFLENEGRLKKWCLNLELKQYPFISILHYTAHNFFKPVDFSYIIIIIIIIIIVIVVVVVVVVVVVAAAAAAAMAKAMMMM